MRVPPPGEERPAGGDGACYVPTFISSRKTSNMGPPTSIGSSMMQRSPFPGLAVPRI